jgi:ABC-type multidrug transport system fused ATPase/permease subunit
MDPKEFEQILAPYKNIRDGHVEDRLKFYKDNFDKKRRCSENAKLAILILSLLIPVVASLNSIFPNLDLKEMQGLIVSVMALLIAFFTGLNELKQWQRLWQEYTIAKVQIETLIDSWDIEVAKARLLDDAKKISDVLEQATNTLRNSVDNIVLKEMGSFFDRFQKPLNQTGEKN